MSRNRRLAFWAVIAVQAVVLLGMIRLNEDALARGQKVTLLTVPVDPLDLFRGNYAALQYEISDVTVPAGVQPGETVYVPLFRDGDIWSGSYSARVPPSEGAFIRGTVRSVTDQRAHVEYGIETYYADEAEAQNLQRAGRLLVTVALDGHGRARISRVEPVR